MGETVLLVVGALWIVLSLRELWRVSGWGCRPRG